MALKITLKPKEKIIISGAVITNGGSTARLLLENNVPVLRASDIMKESETRTPARRIYFAIQSMYIDPAKITAYHDIYWKLVQDFIKAVPSSLSLIDRINEQIISDRHYQALKLARKLIEYEEKIKSQANAPSDPEIETSGVTVS